MVDIFLDAYNLARTQYSDHAWHCLPQGGQARAIYRAMHQIEAQAFKRALDADRQRQRDISRDITSAVGSPVRVAGDGN